MQWNDLGRKDLSHTSQLRSTQCSMYRFELSRKEKQQLKSELLFKLFAHHATDDLNTSVVDS